VGSIIAGLLPGSGCVLRVVLPAGRTLEGLEPGDRPCRRAWAAPTPEPRRDHGGGRADEPADDERPHHAAAAAAAVGARVAHDTSRWAMNAAISSPSTCTYARGLPPIETAITTPEIMYAQAAPPAAIQAVESPR
jgi:hypothetical protein